MSLCPLILDLTDLARPLCDTVFAFTSKHVVELFVLSYLCCHFWETIFDAVHQAIEVAFDSLAQFLYFRLILEECLAELWLVLDVLF